MAGKRFFPDGIPAEKKCLIINNLNDRNGARLSRPEMSGEPFYVDGQWYVDPSTDRIRAGDRETKVEPRVMGVLCHLAARPGQVVSREELEAEVWAGMVVGYDALTSAIIKLRKAFDDDSRNPRIIETVSKRGYRLIAPVSPANPAAVEKSPSLPAKGKAGLWIGAVLVVAIAAALAWFVGRHEAPTVIKRDQPALVVLPFNDLTVDGKQNYLAEGITEDIATDVSKYSGIQVIARYSAQVYRRNKPALADLRKELGVTYVVSGSVQKSDQRVRVNVELVDAVSGKQLWAERFDTKRQDLFEVQDNIRSRVVEALAIPLTDEEKRYAARRYTNSLEAYNAFTQARASYARHTREASVQARQYLQTALAIDPGFARAYSLLALTHVDDFRFNWSKDPMESVRQAEAAALKAIDLDKQLPQAHWVLGYIYLFGLKRQDEAIKQGLQTLEIDPNHADGHMLLAATYIYVGKPELTLQYAAQAMRLNPHYPSQYPSMMGYAYYFLGNHEEARKYLDQAIMMNPGRVPPTVYSIANLAASGDIAGAQWQLENLRLPDRDFNINDWAARQPFASKELLDKVADDLRKAIVIRD